MGGLSGRYYLQVCNSNRVMNDSIFEPLCIHVLDTNNYGLMSSYSDIVTIAGLTKRPIINEFHNDDIFTMTVICIKKSSSKWKPWPSQGSILQYCLAENQRNSKDLHVACATELSKAARHWMKTFLGKYWMRKDG